MDDKSTEELESNTLSPQREPAGDFVVPIERTEESSFLSVPQQRKKDALDIAELIYDIYNESCPIQPSSVIHKGENDV